MKVNYKIVSVYPEFHSIEVIYWTDGIPQEKGVPVMIEVDLVPAPSGAYLHTYIQQHTPFAALRLTKNILCPETCTDMKEYEDLKGQEFSAEVKETHNINMKMPQESF